MENPENDVALALARERRTQLDYFRNTRGLTDEEIIERKSLSTFIFQKTIVSTPATLKSVPTPPPALLQQQIQCGASWEIKPVQSGYIAQCRHCQVMLSAGGTPKCLKR